MKATVTIGEVSGGIAPAVCCGAPLTVTVPSGLQSKARRAPRDKMRREPMNKGDHHGGR